ncbi:MAG: hypothetical protein IIT86_10100, partial [Oscillospiraceae bacterium]|nr:hypothetical protein [Oscillospiraceae bacterium]
DLDRTQDVFVVPGNHDVGNKDDMSKCFPGDEDWSMRMEMAVTKLRSSWPSDKADAKRTMPENYLRWRMESYRPYCVPLLRLGFRGFRPGFPGKNQQVNYPVSVFSSAGKTTFCGQLLGLGSDSIRIGKLLKHRIF